MEAGRGIEPQSPVRVMDRAASCLHTEARHENYRFFRRFLADFTRFLSGARDLTLRLDLGFLGISFSVPNLQSLGSGLAAPDSMTLVRDDGVVEAYLLNRTPLADLNRSFAPVSVRKENGVKASPTRSVALPLFLIIRKVHSPSSPHQRASTAWMSHDLPEGRTGLAA